MSRVRVLVGTRKGAFVLTADGKRRDWDVSGPHFGGWEMYHVKGSPADPDRVYASQSGGWFGQLIQRSDDGGRRGTRSATSSPTRATRAPTSGTTARRMPWEFKRVWHLEPSLDRPRHGLRRRRGRRPVPLGGRRADAGRSCPGCAATAPGRRWQPGAGGMCLHTILLDPSDPDRIFVAISAAGAFRSDDGGTTWRPINRGLRSEDIPDPDAEVGHCVHHVAMHPSRPDVLFMQKHWDVMRSDDGGESWREISGNLPTDFGFTVDVHAHEPDTVYVVPITSDYLHVPLDGRLRVYRSRSGGDDWEPLTSGLPQEHCYVNVLRDAMAVDSLDECGVYFGTTGGQVYASADAGDTWSPIVRDLPAVLSVEVQTLPCHGPRRLAGTPAGSRARRRRGVPRRRGTGHPAVRPRRARGELPDAARHDPRPGDAAPAPVRAILRVRAGPVPRTAGRAAARTSCGRGGTVTHRRGDGGRMTPDPPTERRLPRHDQRPAAPDWP